MKKSSLSIFILVFVIVLTVGLTACSSDNDQKVPFENVKGYFDKVSLAKSVSHSVVVSADSTEVYSSSSLYAISGDNVHIERTTKTLNEDITAKDLYVTNNEEKDITKAELVNYIPQKLNVPADITRDLNYEKGVQNVLTFKVDDGSAESFLGVTADEAEDISGLTVKVVDSNEYISLYEISYNTANGNKTTVTFSFNY